MTSEFVTLKSLAHVITKGTTPTKAQGYTDDGINFIRALSIDENGQLDEETFLKISNKTNDDLKRSIVQEGDVLYTIAGVIGRVTVVEKKHLPANLNQALAIIRPKKDKISSRYLANLLRSHDAQFYLKSRVVESVQANLSLGELGHFPVEKLPLAAQNNRNKALELIEDKSRSCSLISDISENLISSLFRSWFIDFDPVKAKAEGKLPYGMDEETAALFPDSFEDSELGPIPAGWKVGRVEDILDVSWGDTDVTKKSYSEDGFPAFSAKGQDGYLQYYDYEQWGIVLSAIGANCGNTWIASGKWSCIKNTMRFIELKAENEFVPYFYYLSKNPYFWPIRGSAQPFIGMNDVKKIKILIPNSALIQKFSELSKKMLDTLHINETIGEKLSRARDTLLPRLMSGDLEVPMEA